MTYVHRKRFTRKPKDILLRKPKDILLLALRNLGVSKDLDEDGEHLICTRKSYEAMMDRIEGITESLAPRKFGITRHGAIWKIWRTV